jgi:hypothetical protein
MVGIHKKVKELLNVIQQYAPLLSKFVPGLGEIVESVSGGWRKYCRWNKQCILRLFGC